MEIWRCFEILELDNNVTLDDAKQSYKDLVNIWHPDRFANNPRLKKKSEDKLKEINIAYETIIPFLSSKKSIVPQSIPESKAQNEAKTEIKANASRATRFYRPETEAGSKDKTEHFVETGTEIILGLFSSLYANFRRIVADVKSEIDPGTHDPRRKNDNTRVKGTRGRAGRGRGMGKRGGGRLRGRK